VICDKDPLALRWWVVAGEQDLESLPFIFVTNPPSDSSSYNPFSTSRSSELHNCDRRDCRMDCFERQSPVDDSTTLSLPSGRVFTVCLGGVGVKLTNPLTLGFERRYVDPELGDGVCSSSVDTDLRRSLDREIRTMAVHELATGISLMPTKCD
jgi:hypothetical protein